MSDVPCFIGIDVAKAQLDIAIRPSGARWAVPNDASGVPTLVDRLQALQPTLIVLEATGGLERLVPSALATAGLPVVVVNPRQVRDFARATGQLAKTDALDARALAHFADVIRPTPRPLPAAQTAVDDPQRHAEASDALASPGGRRLKNIQGPLDNQDSCYAALRLSGAAETQRRYDLHCNRLCPKA
jgi:hypothetical protein